MACKPRVSVTERWSPAGKAGERWSQNEEATLKLALRKPAGVVGRKIPRKYVGKDGLERISGESEGQELQAAHTERSLKYSEVRKEVDSFKRWKCQDQVLNYCCWMGLGATWAGCKMLPARGGSTLKNPFQPKLSCDSMTDFDRVDFYWDKKQLD